jgi:hypothetical protein
MDNPELGRLVLKRIEAEPELFDMETYGMITPCGTVACLAGHAMLASGYVLRETGSLFDPLSVFIRPDGTPVHDKGREAAGLLGLTDGEFRGEDYRLGGIQIPLFHGMQSRERAIARFRALVEAAEE